MFKKTLATVFLAGVLALAGASAASADTYPADIGCTANPATIAVGQTSVVTCTGLEPGVTGLFSVVSPSGDTIATRTITTDDEGNATFSIVGPAAGTYTVTLVADNGQSGSAAITVTAASTGGGGGGSLPTTGSEVPAAAIWLGVGAIGIGGIAVAAAVARRRAASNR